MKKLIINLGFILGVSTMLSDVPIIWTQTTFLRNVLTLRMCFKVKTIPMSGWQKDTLI